MQVSGEAKPLPHKLAPSAFWFPTIGPTAKTNDSAAMTKVLNVRVVFGFIDMRNIFLYFSYGSCVIYTPSYIRRNVLQRSKFRCYIEDSDAPFRLKRLTNGDNCLLMTVPFV